MDQPARRVAYGSLNSECRCLKLVDTFRDGKIAINGYTVVNGCQSLTTLFENRNAISSELRLLTRLIQLPPDSPLAAKITRHSNNQNAISARDLQSNSTIQRRLQTEVAARSGGNTHYEIKRGDTSATSTVTITNEEAARILLAFDLQEPWSCHQTYRLFDDRHSPIFGRPEVTAERIMALYEVYLAVVETLPQLESDLLAKYRLTRFFLIYLLRRVLDADDRGKAFCQRPAEFFSEDDGPARIRACATAILKDLLVDVNAELKEREHAGTPFDFKRELKGASAVRSFSQQIIPMYEKALNRGRVNSFSQEWKASMTG